MGGGGGVEIYPTQWKWNLTWQAGRRVAGRVLCALRFGVPPSEGGRKEGGVVYLRGLGGLPFLPEEVEARAVFPMGTGHADVGRRKPGPLDEVVVGPYKSYFHSTLHVPAVT